jgi:hypothetical protein
MAKVRQVKFSPAQAEALRRAESDKLHDEVMARVFAPVLLCAYVPRAYKHKLPYVDKDGSEGICEAVTCPCRAAKRYATDKKWFESSE